MAQISDYSNAFGRNTNSASRTDIFNPDFNVPVGARGVRESDNFTRNLYKYADFVSWARWYPDLFYDLITPETGGIRLDLDQRVLLRSLARFVSTYGVLPRGYGKTFIEDLGMYHAAIFFPDIELSLSAQTRENASKLLSEKHREIMRFYPLMQREITKSSFTKDMAEVHFVSGAIIDILANHQSTKGARRKRLNIEEAALLNNELFQDVLEPIPNVPRRTIGKLALVNPEELNGQINFFTTSGFRGSDEYERNVRMYDEMLDLKGVMVLGAGWELACQYGRGETKSQILNKKAKNTPLSFAMNYESKWVGATDGSLVDINKLLSARTLARAELSPSEKHDYYISMDIARSSKKTNNQSSISVLKAIRNSEHRIRNIQQVNLVNLPNGLNFTAQAIELKRYRKQYKAKTAIIDKNGLGVGLLDELMKEHIDPVTKEVLECWDTINTDDKPDVQGAEKCLYALEAQGINSDIIVNFIDMVESGKLQLLEKRQDANYSIDDAEYIKSEILPFLQTDLLIEEVSNLKIKPLNGGKLTVEKATNSLDKDRYSALAYGLWYIKTFEDKPKEKHKLDISKTFAFRKPKKTTYF